VSFEEAVRRAEEELRAEAAFLHPNRAPSVDNSIKQQAASRASEQGRIYKEGRTFKVEP
jgi:hypothetical protein